MKRLFIQATIFSRRIDERDRAGLLEQIEQQILEDPDAGDVIPGTGGVRKLRVVDALRNKGRRGGHRVLYLDLPNRETTYLLHIYGKDEAEDLDASEKRMIRALVRKIKEER